MDERRQRELRLRARIERRGAERCLALDKLLGAVFRNGEILLEQSLD